MLPKYLPLLGQIAHCSGGHHAESSDRIRAAEDRYPCDLLLRRGRDLAQRLGFLGAVAADQPHHGDRGGFGEPLQGDAQSAHRSIDDLSAAECPPPHATPYHKIPPRPPPSPHPPP